MTNEEFAAKTIRKTVLPEIELAVKTKRTLASDQSILFEENKRDELLCCQGACSKSILTKNIFFLFKKIFFELSINHIREKGTCAKGALIWCKKRAKNVSS